MDTPDQPLDVPIVEAEPANLESASLQSASPVAGAGRSRRRWVLGGAVAVAAVAGGIWAASFLGARPLPEALRYLPAGSVVVAAPG